MVKLILLLSFPWKIHTGYDIIFHVFRISKPFFVLPSSDYSLFPSRRFHQSHRFRDTLERLPSELATISFLMNSSRVFPCPRETCRRRNFGVFRPLRDRFSLGYETVTKLRSAPLNYYRISEYDNVASSRDRIILRFDILMHSGRFRRWRQTSTTLN